MRSKVEKTIREYGLINEGDRVLCGVSGGADSVVLLHILNGLSQKIGFTLIAAHFNHGIRGESADSDEKFVRELCVKMGIELHIKRADVPSYAKEMGYTLEQAGRIMRYDFFNELHPDKIAVAHHMDDQAESVLMHIIRGSGTSGICGMRYMRGNIIRPLLCVRRREIEQYANEHGLAYCQDATNFVADGTRNILRLEIIPEITEKLNSSFTESLCRMADIVSRDDDFMQDMAEKELEKCSLGDNCYDRTGLDKINETLKNRALRIAMQRAGAFADIEQKHINQVTELLSARTGAEIHLPHVTAWTSYEKIYFATKAEFAEISQNLVYNTELSLPGRTCLPCGVIVCECVDGNSFVRGEKNVSFVDADKMQGVVCRSRQNGDRIHPVGSCGSKKLKDFFIDRKIGRYERNMPLICCGSDVLCIVGMTVAEEVCVTDTTSRMYKFTYIRRESNGRIHE